MSRRKTFVDAGVLIAAARGRADVAAHAMKILDDPDRESQRKGDGSIFPWKIGRNLPHPEGKRREGVRRIPDTPPRFGRMYR